MATSAVGSGADADRATEEQLRVAKASLAAAVGQLSLIQQALDSKLLRRGGVSRSLTLATRDQARAADALIDRNRALVSQLTYALAELPLPSPEDAVVAASEPAVGAPQAAHARGGTGGFSFSTLQSTLAEMAEGIKERGASLLAGIGGSAGTNGGAVDAGASLLDGASSEDEEPLTDEAIAPLNVDDEIGGCGRVVYSPLLMLSGPSADKVKAGAAAEVAIAAAAEAASGGEAGDLPAPPSRAAVRSATRAVTRAREAMTAAADSSRLRRSLRHVLRAPASSIGGASVAAAALADPRLLARVFSFFSHAEAMRTLAPVCRGWRAAPLRADMRLLQIWAQDSAHYRRPALNASASSHGLEPSLRSSLWSDLATSTHAPLAVDVAAASEAMGVFSAPAAAVVATSPPESEALLLRLSAYFAFPALRRWLAQRAAPVAESLAQLQGNAVAPAVAERKRSLTRIYCDDEDDGEEEDDDDDNLDASAQPGTLRKAVAPAWAAAPRSRSGSCAPAPAPTAAAHLSTAAVDWLPAVRLRSRTLLKILFCLSADGTQALAVRRATTNFGGIAEGSAANSAATGGRSLAVGRQPCAPLRRTATLQPAAAHALRLSSLPAPARCALTPRTAAERAVAEAALASHAVDNAATAAAATSDGDVPATPAASATEDGSWKLLPPADEVAAEEAAAAAVKLPPPAEIAFAAYAAAGASLRRACDELTRVQAAAAAVRAARAAVNGTLAQIQAAAQSDAPLDANVSVRFAGFCDAVAAREAEVLTAADAAAGATAAAHVDCAAADATLVRELLRSWADYVRDIAAAWVARRLRSASDGGGALTAQYFAHPATGRLVPTDGFAVPATSCGVAASTAAATEALRAAWVAVAGHAPSAPPPLAASPAAGLRSQRPAYTSLHPMLPLPPRLADALVAAALADSDEGEEIALGLEGLVLTPADAAARKAARPPPGPVRLSLGPPAEGVSLPPPAPPPADEAEASVAASATARGAQPPPSLLAAEAAVRSALRTAARRQAEEQLERASAAAAAAAAEAGIGGHFEPEAELGARPQPWTELILPGLPVDVQHTVVDADVKRTFGELDALLRAARRREAMAAAGSSGSSPLVLRDLLPTAFIAGAADEPLTMATVALLRYRLRRVLLAVTAFDSDCGYCQGANFLTATFLLHAPTTGAAFWGLSNLLFSPELRFAEVFSAGLSRVALSFFLLRSLTRAHLPTLAAHLDAERVAPDMYAAGWVMTLFSSRETLPLPYFVPIWDALLAGEGWKVVLRVILALLEAASPDLLLCDFAAMVQFLHKYPTHRLPPTPAALLAAAARFKVTRRILGHLEQRHLAPPPPPPAPRTKASLKLSAAAAVVADGPPPATLSSKADSQLASAITPVLSHSSSSLRITSPPRVAGAASSSAGFVASMSSPLPPSLVTSAAATAAAASSARAVAAVPKRVASSFPYQDDDDDDEVDEMVDDDDAPGEVDAVSSPQGSAASSRSPAAADVTGFSATVASGAATSNFGPVNAPSLSRKATAAVTTIPLSAASSPAPMPASAIVPAVTRAPEAALTAPSLVRAKSVSLPAPSPSPAPATAPAVVLSRLPAPTPAHVSAPLSTETAKSVPTTARAAEVVPPRRAIELPAPHLLPVAHAPDMATDMASPFITELLGGVAIADDDDDDGVGAHNVAIADDDEAAFGVLGGGAWAPGGSSSNRIHSNRGISVDVSRGSACGGSSGLSSGVSLAQGTAAAPLLAAAIPADVYQAVAQRESARAAAARSVTGSASIKGRLSSSSAGAPVAAPLLAARLFSHDPLAASESASGADSGRSAEAGFFVDVVGRGGGGEGDEDSDEGFDGGVARSHAMGAADEDDGAVAQAVAAAAAADLEEDAARGPRKKKGAFRFLKRLVGSAAHAATAGSVSLVAHSTGGEHAAARVAVATAPAAPAVYSSGDL